MRSTPRTITVPTANGKPLPPLGVGQLEGRPLSAGGEEKVERKKKARKGKGKDDGSSPTAPLAEKVATAAALPHPVDLTIPSKPTTVPPRAPHKITALPPAPQKPSPSQSTPDYAVRRGVHMSSDELMGVINKLFAEPISSSITWAQFFAFSPRAVRMFTDRLKAKRVSSDTSTEEVLVESSFLDAAADTSSDMFDELLSMLLDQVDLDDLTGGRVKDSERKPKKASLRLVAGLALWYRQLGMSDGEWVDCGWEEAVNGFAASIEGCYPAGADAAEWDSLRVDGWDVVSSAVNGQKRLNKLLRKKGVLTTEESVTAVLGVEHSMGTPAILGAAEQLLSEGLVNRPLDMDLLNWCLEAAGFSEPTFQDVEYPAVDVMTMYKPAARKVRPSG
ncbi:hypothetical protein HDU67_004575, partial [Dinochytrium kinnereticum]